LTSHFQKHLSHFRVPLRQFENLVIQSTKYGRSSLPTGPNRKDHFSEWLPLAEKTAGVKFTKDPDGRGVLGASSGGAAAMSMTWFHPDLYRRVISYSGTFVGLARSPTAPHGAWEYHENFIPQSEKKPIRIWLEVGDKDLLNPNVMRDNMHDWVVANENMAKGLAAKGYRYQFVFARNAAHCDRPVKQQTLPAALEWLWKGY
jgi:predicted alpha/beta superfamily hydrolase